MEIRELIFRYSLRASQHQSPAKSRPPFFRQMPIPVCDGGLDDARHFTEMAQLAGFDAGRGDPQIEFAQVSISGITAGPGFRVVGQQNAPAAALEHELSQTGHHRIADQTASTGKGTAAFEGKADVPTMFFLFEEDAGRIIQRQIDSPAFTGKIVASFQSQKSR